MIEAVEPFRLHPTSIPYIHKVFQPPSTVVHGYMAAYSHQYHHRHFPRFRRVRPHSRWCKCVHHAGMQWLRLYSLSDCIPHPCHTHTRVWGASHVADGHMAAQHTHTSTTTDISPDLGELCQILLADVSVQTMMLCNGFGCRIFQTASHIHAIHT